MAREARVQVKGVAEFRRNLRKLDRDADRRFRLELIEAAGPIASEAAGLAPRRSGALARSIRPYVSGARVSVGSPLPYAPVVHWGGTIRPRGEPITFPRRDFITQAVDHHAYRLVEDLGDAIEHAARAAGFRTT